MNGDQHNPIITVENLMVGYAGNTVLKEVSFSVSRGEVFTVLGPSGCGKTTLLKAMTGLLPIAKGKISIAGQEIGPGHRKDALRRLRSRIGVLFQSGALFGSLTLWDNVMLPLMEFTDLPPELMDMVAQLKLDLVKLGKDGNRMPAELSGGMKRRAGLARAMALDPQVLFCDEPTSGLDPPTAVEIDDLLLELKTALGVTVVLVAHELSTVENVSDRCIMLDGEAKTIIARGTVESLKRESKDPRVQAFFKRKVKSKHLELGQPL